MRKHTVFILIPTLMLLSGCSRDSNTNSSSGGAADQQAQSRGQNASGDTNASNYPPNNTGINERDRSGATLTPGDQGSSDSDRKITAQVRRMITSNSKLSADAGNVKIITQGGRVTLRGPVNNAEEQQTIAELAKTVPGVSTVDNQLELKSNQ